MALTFNKSPTLAALGMQSLGTEDVLEVDEDAPISQQETIVDRVERLIALDAQVNKLLEDPRIKQLAELKKMIKAELEDACPTLDKEFLVPAPGGRVELTKASMSREVTNKAALLLLLGEKTFVDIANFALKDIDKYLGEEEKTQVLTVDPHGGARSLKIIHTQD